MGKNGALGSLHSAGLVVCGCFEKCTIGRSVSKKSADDEAGKQVDDSCPTSWLPESIYA